MEDVDSVSASRWREYSKNWFLSPPVYVRNSVYGKEDESDELVEVGDACRCFEKYLVEMIVDEGELKDMRNVEELLYCWRYLKNPVFIELVGRFYGELCKDLFAPFEEQEKVET